MAAAKSCLLCGTLGNVRQILVFASGKPLSSLYAGPSVRCIHGLLPGRVPFSWNTRSIRAELPGSKQHGRSLLVRCTCWQIAWDCFVQRLSARSGKGPRKRGMFFYRVCSRCESPRGRPNLGWGRRGAGRIDGMPAIGIEASFPCARVCLLGPRSLAALVLDMPIVQAESCSVRGSRSPFRGQGNQPRSSARPPLLVGFPRFAPAVSVGMSLPPSSPPCSPRRHSGPCLPLQRTTAATLFLFQSVTKNVAI